MEIDWDSPVPAYQQIADWLRGRIERGELTGRLPSAVDLAQELGVAVLTGRRALQVLTEAGIAEVSPGRGTYVRRDPGH